MIFSICDEMVRDQNAAAMTKRSIDLDEKQFVRDFLALELNTDP